MSPFVRSLFFWLLVTIFLATTPLFIFYFMGYRYSIERGVFIYTGSVSIQANPTQDLDIRIDGVPVSGETNRINRSYHVEGILPGKHAVSVTAPGFSVWSKEITVRSGVATEFWNILLARDTYDQTSFPAPAGSLAFFPAPDSKRIAVLSQENGEVSVSILGATTGENMSRVFSATRFLPIQEGLESALRWSPRDDASFLLSLRSAETGDEHIFLVRTDTFSATDLKDIVSVPLPREVLWNPNADTILFLSKNSLFELPVGSPLQETTLSENTESYDIVGNTIISLEPKTGILYRFPRTNSTQKTQITTAPPEGFPHDIDTAFSLTAYDETRIAILNRNTGDLFLYNQGEETTTFTQLSSDAKGLQFSNDGKKILFWTDWEIFASFTRKWEVQPTREEGDRLDIGRFSNMISYVQWTKDYEHILFSSGNDTKAIELDNRGGRDTITLQTLPSPPLQLSGLGSQNKVYSLQSDSVGNTSLSFITFPEPIGFFGFGG